MMDNKHHHRQIITEMTRLLISSYLGLICIDAEQSRTNLRIEKPHITEEIDIINKLQFNPKPKTDQSKQEENS